MLTRRDTLLEGMSKNLLLVTPDANFARVLLQAVERDGHRIHVVRGKGEAIVRAEEQDCSLAFLDTDLGDRSILDIGLALRTLRRPLAWFCFQMLMPLLRSTNYALGRSSENHITYRKC